MWAPDIPGPQRRGLVEPGLQNEPVGRFVLVSSNGRGCGVSRWCPAEPEDNVIVGRAPRSGLQG